MDLILVARSVGKPTGTSPLRREGHADLIFNLGRQGMDDHWIAQGGPNSGYLTDGLRHCPSHGWYHEFANAHGAIWDTGGALLLPIITLMEMCAESSTSSQLASIAEEINRRRLRYNYDTGPNSNTYVRMFLDRMGILLPEPPRGGLELKCWGWR